MSNLLKQCKTALLLLVCMSILTGILYPACVTLVAQLLFPHKANGSLIQHQDKIIGSTLIGQYFNEDKYFWPRPSYTPLFPYNAEHSSGSNLGPNNPKLIQEFKQRIMHIKKTHPEQTQTIPIDLLMGSASGLDPEISLDAAVYQASRIAKARGITKEKIIGLINNKTIKRTLGILGEPRVNVLELNLELEGVRSNSL